jgi:hypothetical protein
MTNQTAKTSPTTCYSPITHKSLTKKSNVDSRRISSVQCDRLVMYVALDFRE